MSANGLVAAPPTPVKFNRDIRPIMSDTCFRCHGPDKSSRMAGLRLDLRDQATQKTKTGVTPIVPGDPDKSAIVQRVFSTNPGKIMPPKFAHKELSQAQKEIIKRWVAEGATYEGHWSYQPLKRPAVPEVEGATIRNPIDAFVQERLAREGLKASPEADKRTLLRRVTLDLTGVPPTPAELTDFLKDTGPDAYDKVADRLLASPAYAETRARYWLDGVRFADSAGFHGDNLWPAWPYRDYVLKAFRENMPFDRFTREQIAGDLLPNPTVEQRVASAYNRMSRASAEGGLQEKEYIAKYGADRVRTTATVWLGATMGCAECHDHKFDPITLKDFYSFKAFFADIKETGLVSDRGARAWGSKLLLATPEQEARLKDLDEKIRVAKEDLAKRVEAASLAGKRADWESNVLAAHRGGKLAWQFQKPASAKADNGATLTIYNSEPLDFNYYLSGSLASERKPGGGLIVASGPNPDNEIYTIQLKPGAGTWTALGVEAQQDESLPGNRLSRGADRFVLSEVDAEVSQAGATPKKIEFALATSTGFGEWPEHPAPAAMDGDPKTGWGVGFGEHRNVMIALRFKQKIETASDTIVTVRLRHESDYRRATIGRFRLALSSGEFSYPEIGDSGRKSKVAKTLKEEVATLNVSTDLGIPPDVLKALETDEPERNESMRTAVADFYAWSSPELQEPVIQIAKLEAERAMFDASIPRVLQTERIRPRITRLMPRANWMDETTEIVEPAVPGFLGKLDTQGRRATRLDLADWIVSKDNPLTARVYVNRMWRQLFGTGLSKVMEDLGSQGEWPSHPELIDWLAAEFTENWDMKHITRLMVTSHTYRQSSVGAPQLNERDPDNRLLARQSRFRVDAESVHDVALAVAGLLVDKFGGPSVKPYQPDGYLTGMNFPKREYSASHGDELYRRAVYTQWQRTFLHPSLLTLDAPTREECTVNRVNSNTPLQALVLLNDPIFVEAARVFAQNTLRSGGKKFDDQLTWAFQRALNRAPEKEERRILTDLHSKGLRRFNSAPDAAAQFLSIGESPVAGEFDLRRLAAMSTVTRAILNLHETITRN